MSNNKLDLDIMNGSTDPRDHGIQEFKSWDELFEFQLRKDGASYLMLRNWMEEHFDLPKMKKK